MQIPMLKINYHNLPIDEINNRKDIPMKGLMLSIQNIGQPKSMLRRCTLSIALVPFALCQSLLNGIELLNGRRGPGFRTGNLCDEMCLWAHRPARRSPKMEGRGLEKWNPRTAPLGTPWEPQMETPRDPQGQTNPAAAFPAPTR